MIHRIEDHTVEYIMNTTGCMDPWLIQYEKELGRDMQKLPEEPCGFILVDGEQTYRMKDTFKEDKFIWGCKWEEFNRWIPPYIDKDFGKLSENKKISKHDWDLTKFKKAIVKYAKENDIEINPKSSVGFYGFAASLLKYTIDNILEIKMYE